MEVVYSCVDISVRFQEACILEDIDSLGHNMATMRTQLDVWLQDPKKVAVEKEEPLEMSGVQQ